MYKIRFSGHTAKFCCSLFTVIPRPALSPAFSRCRVSSHVICMGIGAPTVPYYTASVFINTSFRFRHRWAVKRTLG